MRADGDIKRDVEAELSWDVGAPVTDVSVQVSNGVVTLSGHVPSVFQKHEAARAARFVSGVTAIANDIVVRSHEVSRKTDPEIAQEIVAGLKCVGNAVHVAPAVASDDVKVIIEESFRHRAEIDASRVAVNADGSEVTLRGKVRSWTEREEAQRCAWSAPGVTKVTNNLRVKP